MSDGSNPDRMCLLIEPVDKDTVSSKGNTYYDRSENRIAEILISEKISTCNKERPVPDSPESASV